MEQQPVQLHMEQFTFKLADFEGPLDLLLYLVSKNKMSLADIEIVKLIDQYVSIVHGVRAEEMESASEFIEMAARLVQMKSFFLLPKSEEAERMREELTGMLVEYSLCKEVAAKLRAMGEGDVYKRQNQIREAFGLVGTPVRILIRERGEKI